MEGVKDARKELRDFFFDRLRIMFKDQGYTAQEIDAVLSLNPDQLNEIPARLAAVRSFEKLPESEALAAANKRISNILKKIEGEVPTKIDPSLFESDAEKALSSAIDQVEPAALADFEAGHYEEMLSRLSTLKTPVDEFFDKVMVNADDPALRANPPGAPRPSPPPDESGCRACEDCSVIGGDGCEYSSRFHLLYRSGDHGHPRLLHRPHSHAVHPGRNPVRRHEGPGAGS